ncbi:MAG: hypothetical protein LBB36_03740 [Fibromonadaceae bacterium]|jgi:hypothetical protein|nr:hypothetical protein [Fibromonadaceae bacterium]
MQKLEPPDFSNLPDIIDPENIPGIDYYLEAFEKPDDGYPKCPNDFDDLTVKGCLNAANLIGPRFKEIWDKSTELMYGKR